MTIFIHPDSGQVQTAHSPAVESFLRSRGYELHATAEDAADLKGAALDEALDEADLSKSGTADEKRTRLAEFVAENDHPDDPEDDPIVPSQDQ